MTAEKSGANTKHEEEVGTRDLSSQALWPQEQAAGEPKVWSLYERALQIAPTVRPDLTPQACALLFCAIGVESNALTAEKDSGTRDTTYRQKFVDDYLEVDAKLLPERSSDQLRKDATTTLEDARTYLMAIYAAQDVEPWE